MESASDQFFDSDEPFRAFFRSVGEGGVPFLSGHFSNESSDSALFGFVGEGRFRLDGAPGDANRIGMTNGLDVFAVDDCSLKRSVVERALDSLQRSRSALHSGSN